MKISGHELKSLNFIIEKILNQNIFTNKETDDSYNISDLCFPLITMIDYLGFRILASSKLPIDNSTINYGTPDQGKHIFYNSINLNRKIETLGYSCNLGPNKLPNHTFYTPLDLEGHIGFDNRYYLIDVGRLFPPIYYNRKKNQENINYLFELFRPEFIFSFHVKNQLVSDCLSPFISHNSSKESTIILEQATNELTLKTIPAFADILLKQNVTASSKNQFIPALHRQGINIRYLGVLYQNLKQKQPNSQWIQIILIEIIARCVKQMLNEFLREIKTRENNYIKTSDIKSNICEFLNCFFSHFNSELLFAYWDEKFLLIIDKFPLCDISFDDFNQLFLNIEFRRNVFLRFKDIFSIQFSNMFEYHLKSNESFHDFLGKEKPFCSFYIKKMKPVIKNLVILDYNKGIVLKREAKFCSVDSPMRLSLLHDSISSFLCSLHNNPSFIPCMLQIADVYQKIGDNNIAREYFSVALRMTNDPIVKYKCARFCHKANAPETHFGYQQAILANFQSFKAWFYYSKYLAENNEDFETVVMCIAATFLVCKENSEREALHNFANQYSMSYHKKIDEIWENVTHKKPKMVSNFWSTKFEQR